LAVSWSVFTTGTTNTILFSLAIGETCRTLRRGERAEQEVDVLAQDEIARDPHRLVGIALGVADDQFDLAAEHATLCVDLLDEHLGALQRRLADQCAWAGENYRVTNANGLLRRGGKRREREADEE
jgi:hypothetical protein